MLKRITHFRLNEKIIFLIKAFFFLYGFFAFISWSLNPSDWGTVSRTLFVIVFLIIAENQ